MLIFLVILITIIAVLMSIVVLLQSGKGGGLAGIASGGGGATQLLGARHAPGILEKATWVLAGSFIVLCILTNFFIDTTAQQESIIQQSMQEAPVQAPAPNIPPSEGALPNNNAPAGDQPAEDGSPEN
jgi:preprotein translocase subunit SecG